MSRFLFVVPPLTGHVNPTVSVGRELASRGHDVAWVAHPRKVRPLLPEGATLFELDDEVPEALVSRVSEKAQRVRGLAALKFLWEDFLLPLGDAMVPGVAAACESFEPDALLCDQQALAGGIVARRRGLPWATSATTSAGVTNPLAGLPKVAEWLAGQLEMLQLRAGLEAVEQPDCSPHGVIVFSTAALVGPPDRFPAHYHFVGPSIHHRADDTPFPWEALADGPRVLVSLGTVNADRGRRFYRAVTEAVTDQPVQVVLAAPPELVGAVPPNVLVRAWVPQLAVLPHVHAVVSHGGHNTVCESLAHGLPLVLAPIKDDQPVVAQQVVDAGAGLRVKFARVTPARLWQALDRVLNEPAYRASAQAVSRSFADAGGAAAAATVLEGLV